MSFLAFIKSLVPECYSSADIDYTRIDEYERKVERATSVLQSVASSAQNATTGTTTIASQCDFDPEKMFKLILMHQS